VDSGSKNGRHMVAVVDQVPLTAIPIAAPALIAALIHATALPFG
jgi:hypothetical protein